MIRTDYPLSSLMWMGHGAENYSEYIDYIWSLLLTIEVIMLIKILDFLPLCIHVGCNRYLLIMVLLWFLSDWEYGFFVCTQNLIVFAFSMPGWTELLYNDMGVPFSCSYIETLDVSFKVFSSNSYFLCALSAWTGSYLSFIYF